MQQYLDFLLQHRRRGRSGPGDPARALVLRARLLGGHVRLVPRLLVPPGARPPRRPVRHRHDILELRPRALFPEHRSHHHTAPSR